MTAGMGQMIARSSPGGMDSAHRQSSWAAGKLPSGRADAESGAAVCAPGNIAAGREVATLQGHENLAIYFGAKSCGQARRQGCPRDEICLGK